MIAIENRKYTREEYFELLAASEVKLEYHYGYIVAMAGGKPTNSLIATNLRRRIAEQLDDKDCLVYDSDLAVEMDDSNRYVFPDATVVCGEEIFSEHNPNVLTNPVLIVEILSKRTENYKFRYYRGIPSLKEYVLISSDKPVVETFYREHEGLWRISAATHLDSSIHLYSLNIDIPLVQIYAKVTGLKEPNEDLPFLHSPS